MEAMALPKTRPQCLGWDRLDMVIREGQAIPNGKPRDRKPNISCPSHYREEMTRHPNKPLLLTTSPPTRTRPRHLHQNKMMRWELSKEVESLNGVPRGGSLHIRSKSIWERRPVGFRFFLRRIRPFPTEAAMSMSPWMRCVYGAPMPTADKNQDRKSVV